MRKYSLSSLFDIQLFAEGAAGDAGAPGEVGGSGQENAGQQNAAIAQQQRGGKANPLAAVIYGKQEEEAKAPDAGEQENPKDLQARFNELIKGEFKDIYAQRIQDTISRRLKGNEAKVKSFEALSPVLDLLGKKYGVDAKDAAALAKAIEDDEGFYEDEAIKTGLSVEELKEKRKMLRENEQLREQLNQAQAKEQADQQYNRWLREADGVKQRYPSFDLAAEVQNPQFLQLLRSGINLQTAFEVVHKDEILPAAMQYASREAERKVANAVMAGQRRPAEGAMANRAPTLIKSDVRSLTRADRDEIERRVARGEKIRF